MEIRTNEKPARKKRRKPSKSPTQIVLAELRKRGFSAQVVEKYVKAPKMFGGGFRKDTWGADLAFLTAERTWLVQAGGATAHTEKVATALAHPEVAEWLSSPVRGFLVWTTGKKLVGKVGRVAHRLTEICRTPEGLEARPFTLS